MLGALLEAKAIAEAGDLEEALRRTSDLLNDDHDRPEALFIAAYCLLKQDRWAIAAALLRRAAQIAPRVAQVWNNLGLCLAQLRQLEEAAVCLERSLEIQPEQTAALNNLALVALNEYRLEDCIKIANRSLAIDPDQKDTLETRGYAYLGMHDWVNGWKGYESAVNSSKWRVTRPVGKEPYWDGSWGKTVLIRGEQGVGDEIQFGSIIPDAIKNCERVIIECDHRLQTLFQRTFPTATVYGTRFEKHRYWAEAEEEKIQASILIGSLPHLYRNSLDAFPGTPYLVCDPDRQAQWKCLLDQRPGLKVGLAWSAGVFNTFAQRRSMRLEDFRPLFDVEGVSFVSLEYRDPRSEIKESGLPILHWKRAVERVDMEETAALISQLDLVICVTTTAADICGALGMPAWVLVPTKPGWKWACPPGYDGRRMPWFRSLECYRQVAEGDWTEPINQIKDRLENLSRRGLTPAGGSHRAAEQHHPQGQQASSDHPASHQPAADQASGADGVHLQPLSLPVPV